MSTRIYTMTHKKFEPPTDPIYIPLHVGRAGKQDLGYLGDDTGEHISDLNCYYGELTGIYWLWQNLDFDGNIGVCHYRRYFVDENRRLLTEQQYDDILSEYDIITSQAVSIDVPYCDYYGEAHNREDLRLEGEVIRELFPEDYPVFEQVMNGNMHYFGNLMVTSRKLFNEYCAWLFTIFAELGNRIDVSTYDAYHKRVFGFLSEQLLLVWIKARGLRAYEGHVSITDEKAETRELKLAVGQLLKTGQVSQARQLFYEIMKVRPDVRLEHSDLLGELPLIEQILYICECEKQRGVIGMLDDSNDLQMLLAHVKRIIQILQSDSWQEEDRTYCRQHHVTAIAVEVLAKNHPLLCGRWEYLWSNMGSLISQEQILKTQN